jgi:hypothetical protein
VLSGARRRLMLEVMHEPKTINELSRWQRYGQAIAATRYTPVQRWHAVGITQQATPAPRQRSAQSLKPR